MNKKLLISGFFFFFVFSLGMTAQEKWERELDKIPEKYKVIITGRLLYEDKSPVAESWVGLSKVREEGGEIKTVIEFFKAENPSSRDRTDKEGKFTIIADRRFWKESGQFSLWASINLSIMGLKDSKGNLLVIKVDENTNKVDLGDIIVEKPEPLSTSLHGAWHFPNMENIIFLRDVVF